MKNDYLLGLGILALLGYGGYTVAKRLIGAHIEKSKTIEEFIGEDPGFKPYYYPAVVKAVCQQESNFDPYAVSVIGASGLMQVMPATAEEIDITVLPADLFDPEINIRIGSAYLKKLFDQSGKDLKIALEKYNVGPGAYSRGSRAENYADNILGYYNGFLEDYRARGEMV